jgi:hypothetical protein
MEGIPDPVGGQVKELGKFHDTDGLVFCHRLRYFEVPA